MYLCLYACISRIHIITNAHVNAAPRYTIYIGKPHMETDILRTLSPCTCSSTALWIALSTLWKPEGSTKICASKEASDCWKKCQHSPQNRGDSHQAKLRLWQHDFEDHLPSNLQTSLKRRWFGQWGTSEIGPPRRRWFYSNNRLLLEALKIMRTWFLHPDYCARLLRSPASVKIAQTFGS